MTARSINKQEIAVAKLQIRLRGYESALSDLGKKRSIAVDMGSSEAVLSKMTSRMSILEKQALKTKDALLMAKLNAGVAQVSMPKVSSSRDLSLMGGRSVSDFAKQFKGQGQQPAFKNPFEVHQKKETSDFIKRMQKQQVDSNTALAQLMSRRQLPVNDLTLMGGRSVSDFAKQMQGQNQVKKDWSLIPKPKAELTDFAKRMQTGSPIAEQSRRAEELKTAKEHSALNPYLRNINATGQESALAKVAIKLREIEQLKAKAGKNLEIAINTGAGAKKIQELTTHYQKLSDQGKQAQSALASGKWSEIGNVMGILSGKTEAAAGALSKLKLFAGVGAGLGIVGATGAANKALDLTKEGMAEGSAAAKTVNNSALPQTARFAASGAGTQEGLQATIRKLVVGVGIPVEQAGEYAELFTQGHLDDKQGIDLVKKLYQKTPDPMGIVRSGVKASQNTGLPIEEAINAALSISSEKGNMISTVQALEGISGMGMTAKDVLHAKGSEVAAFVGQAVHIDKDPAQGIADMNSFIGLLSKPELAMGMKSQDIAGRMGEFKERWGGVMEQSPELARSVLGIDAHQFTFMTEMYKRLPKIQADQEKVEGDKKTGGVLAKLPSIETETSLLQRQAEAAHGSATLSAGKSIRAKTGLTNDMVQDMINSASDESGEGDISRWFRKGIAGAVMLGGRLIGGEDSKILGETALEMASQPQLYASDKSNSKFSANLFRLQREMPVGEGESGLSGAAAPVTQQNTEATKELSGVVKMLTETIKEQITVQKTNTKAPLPAPSPSYQKNQPAWQNRGG
jgi:hypothetical protein